MSCINTTNNTNNTYNNNDKKKKNLGPFCVEFACFLQAFQLPTKVHDMLITDSKLPFGVDVHGSWSLCGPVMDWRPRVYPASCLTAGIGFSVCMHILYIYSMHMCMDEVMAFHVQKWDA